MRRPCKLWPLLFALLAGACAAPAQCVVERITDVTVVRSRDFALMPAQLDGIGATLLVDTGAGITMLSRTLADRLALMPEDRLFPSAVEGIGGMTLTRRMVVDDFRVAGIALGKQNVMLTEPGLFRHFVPEPGGIIGGDFLSHFDADVDLPANRIALYRAHPCATAFAPPWPGVSFYRLPARMTDGGQFLITVAVDGVALTALLDSGAEATAISARAMGKLGLTRESLAADPAREEIGIDMSRRLSHLHHFRSFRIGAETYRQSDIWVSDMPLAPADMLLGADFFQTHRLWLSYATRAVFVAISLGDGASGGEKE